MIRKENTMLNSTKTNFCETAMSNAISSVLYELNAYGHKTRISPEILLESIKFKNGSIESFISGSLAGILKKAEVNLVAAELGHMINSSAYTNGSTVKERAISRETGLRLADHLASSWFDDQNDKNSFMDGIKDFAERDILLEKGYYFWDGQAYEAYKPLPSSIISNRNDLLWCADMIEIFEKNEKRVAETIAKVTTTLCDNVVTGKLNKLLKKFHLIKNDVDEDNIIGDVQWIFDIHSRLYN